MIGTNWREFDGSAQPVLGAVRVLRGDERFPQRRCRLIGFGVEPGGVLQEGDGLRNLSGASQRSRLLQSRPQADLKLPDFAHSGVLQGRIVRETGGPRSLAFRPRGVADVLIDQSAQRTDTLAGEWV